MGGWLPFHSRGACQVEGNPGKCDHDGREQLHG